MTSSRSRNPGTRVPKKWSVMPDSAANHATSDSAGPIVANSQSRIAAGRRSLPITAFPSLTSPHNTDAGGSVAGTFAMHHPNSSCTR